MEPEEKSGEQAWRLRRVGRVIGVLALGLAWLIAAGAYYTHGDRFSPALGALYGIGLATIFLVLHVVRPARASRGVSQLLGRPSAFELAGCLLASTAVTLANVVWVLAFNPIPGGAASLSPTYVAFAVLLFPLIEEFIFRAWLPVALAQLTPAIFAIVISAGLFAALHGKGDWTTHVGVGLSFSAAVVLTGSIWASLLMHVVKNALVLAISSSTVLNVWAVTVSQRYHPGLFVVAWGVNLLVIAFAFVAILRRLRRRPGG